MREPARVERRSWLAGPISAPRRGAMSWQTMLADLALILFMVTAAAMGEAPSPHPAAAPAPAAGDNALWSALGEPLAIWRESASGLSLERWLAGQTVDGRQQLTLVVRYQPAHVAAALKAAQALANAAGASGRSVRIVIEPTAGAGAGAGKGAVEVTAGLAFDRPWS